MILENSLWTSFCLLYYVNYDPSSVCYPNRPHHPIKSQLNSTLIKLRLYTTQTFLHSTSTQIKFFPTQIPTQLKTSQFNTDRCSE